MLCGIWRSISTYRVALACAAINLLHLGMLRIAGLLVVASTYRYNVNREQASFPYILRQIVNQVSGPFVGYLGCKLGIERVTILGCITSSLAIGGCFFAERILAVTICWGICFGISSAMALQLLPTFLPLHFKDNLSKANGVAVAGSALGAVLYFPLYEYLLETYGMSGSFLIVSAICLNALPAAMLLHYSQRQLELSKKRTYVDGITIEKSPEISSDYPTGTTNNTCRTMELGEDHLKPDNLNNLNKVICSSTNLEDGCMLHSGDLQPSWNETDISKDKTTNLDDGRMLHSGDLQPNSNETDISKDKTTNLDDGRMLHSGDLQPSWNETDISKDKTKNLEDGCRLHFADLQPNSNKIYTSKDKTAEDSEWKKLSSIKDNKTCCKCSSAYKNQPPTKSLDVSDPQLIPHEKLIWKFFTLFYDPLFLVLTFTQSSFLVIIQILVAAIVDFALDKGIPTHMTVYALMLSAICDLLGRLLLGFVTDAGCMSPSSFSALCYLCTGAAFAGVALSSEFFALLVSLCWVAAFFGGQMLISPVLVSKYFEGERRTLAMTTRYILAVPLTFIVSPLIGFFRDHLGSYDWLFYSVGAFSVPSSILLLLLPSIAKIGKYSRR